MREILFLQNTSQSMVTKRHFKTLVKVWCYVTRGQKLSVARTRYKSCNTATIAEIGFWKFHSTSPRRRGRRFEKFNSNLTFFDISQHHDRHHATLLKQTSECFMKEKLQYWVFDEKETFALQCRDREENLITLPFALSFSAWLLFFLLHWE